jgi:phosphate transport system substrate-binding protein
MTASEKNLSSIVDRSSNVKNLIRRIPTLAIGFLLVAVSAANARDQIRIVGSSTVFPFSAAVAEEFGRTTVFKTPIVEATGSGGGLKLFCSGIGANHPDITNASRRIKASEIEKCATNGIKAVEIRIGFDGIVFANSKKAPALDISLRQLFLALAKMVPGEDGALMANPHKLWSDIDPSLPQEKIEVLGPPPTSGTRDAFVELAIEGGCKTFPQLKVIKEQDKNRYRAICRSIREDGHYVEAGENDNLIVQKLRANPKAFGVFGYSFLDQNSATIRGSKINGFDPSFDEIAEGGYPISRSLYFYVKAAHVGVIPGIQQFVDAFLSEDAIGDYGYLSEKGLIPLMDDEREAIVKQALTLKPISVDDLVE